MRNLLPSLLLALCLPVAGLAQDHAHSDQDDQPIYEGVWSVRLADGRAARFELREWAGTWRETGARGALPAACHGRKMPVTVQQSTAEGLQFTVFGTSVNPACPDTSYTFKPLDAKTMQAALDGGSTATMTRARR